MSRNDREEVEILFVCTVVFSLKARALTRVTVVRLGISTCENSMTRNTLQSDDTRIAECVTVIDSGE